MAARGRRRGKIMSEQNEEIIEHTPDGDLVIHREPVEAEQPIAGEQPVVVEETVRTVADSAPQTENKVFQRRSLIAGQVNEGAEVAQINSKFGIEGDVFTSETEDAVKNWQSENGLVATGVLTVDQYGRL